MLWLESQRQYCVILNVKQTFHTFGLHGINMGFLQQSTNMHVGSIGSSEFPPCVSEWWVSCDGVVTWWKCIPASCTVTVGNSYTYFLTSVRNWNWSWWKPRGRILLVMELPVKVTFSQMCFIKTKCQQRSRSCSNRDWGGPPAWRKQPGDL